MRIEGDGDEFRVVSISFAASQGEGFAMSTMNAVKVANGCDHSTIGAATEPAMGRNPGNPVLVLRREGPNPLDLHVLRGGWDRSMNAMRNW